MGKHLHVERWFDHTSTGNLRRKRVGAAREKQFPFELRKMYQQHGASALVRHLREKHNLSLAEAWARVKSMFNDKETQS